MKFSEYMNAKGKTVEQPIVTTVADKLEVEPKPTSKAQAKTKKVGKKHDQVKEFVDDKGNVVEKPPVELVPGYNGNIPDAPEKIKGMDTSPKPYKNGKDGTVPNIGKGLADEGPQDLVYTPNAKKGNSPNIPGGTEVKSFLDETRDMSTEEFARHMKGKIGFDAVKSVKDLVKLSESNKNLFFNLAYEVKRNGKLSDLLEALLGIPETYSTIAQLIKEDISEGRVKYLYNAINEAVAPPVGMDDTDDGEEHPHDDEQDDHDDDEMDVEHPDDSEDHTDNEIDDEDYNDEDMDSDDEDEHHPEEDEDMDDENPDEIEPKDQSQNQFPSFKQKYNL